MGATPEGPTSIIDQLLPALDAAFRPIRDALTNLHERIARLEGTTPPPDEHGSVAGGDVLNVAAPSTGDASPASPTTDAPDRLTDPAEAPAEPGPDVSPLEQPTDAAPEVSTAIAATAPEPDRLSDPDPNLPASAATDPGQA